MKTARLKEILEEKATTVRDAYLDISPAFDKECIHEFRTSVKKLRALIRFINTVTGTDVDFPEKFRHAYHISGAIRDRQLMKDHITDTWKLPLVIFHRSLENSLNQLKAAWESHLDFDLIKQLPENLSDQVQNGLHPKDLREAYDKQMEHTNELDANISDKDLHEERKVLKDLLYNLKMAKKDWPKAAEAMPDLEDKLDNICDLIGDYNDSRNTIKELSTFKSPEITQEEQMHLNNLKQQYRDHMIYRKVRIMALLKEMATNTRLPQA